MRRIVHLLTAVALAGGVSTVSGTAASAKSGSPSQPVVVAAGLNNPRQMSFNEDGTLYVAEAGTGQLGASDKSGACVPSPEGGMACSGNTSSITAIRRAGGSSPKASRVVTGLLSFADETGAGATGVDAVSVSDHGNIYAIETYGPGGLPKSVASQNGKLLRIDHEGHIQIVADIGSYALAHPLPGHAPDTNPYGVLRKGGNTYVADAANNVLYNVEHQKIEKIATFEFQPHDPFDGVPTSIASRGDKIYVGQLSGLNPGAAKITVFDEHGKRLKMYTGLSSVTGVAVARNGDIYATEIFTGQPFNSPGALVKIPHDGGPCVVTTLPAPGGVAVDDSGRVYVSINSVSAGTGQVIRFGGGGDDHHGEH